MKASYIFILAGFLLVNCSDPVQDDSKDDGKEKAVDKKEVKMMATHRFRSTETGVEEYMSMRQNAESEKEWFYSSAANPEDVSLVLPQKTESTLFTLWVNLKYCTFWI